MHARVAGSLLFLSLLVEALVLGPAHATTRHEQTNQLAGTVHYALREDRAISKWTGVAQPEGISEIKIRHDIYQREVLTGETFRIVRSIDVKRYTCWRGIQEGTLSDLVWPRSKGSLAATDRGMAYPETHLGSEYLQDQGFELSLVGVAARKQLTEPKNENCYATVKVQHEGVLRAPAEAGVYRVSLGDVKLEGIEIEGPSPQVAQVFPARLITLSAGGPLPRITVKRPIEVAVESAGVLYKVGSCLTTGATGGGIGALTGAGIGVLGGPFAVVTAPVGAAAGGAIGAVAGCGLGFFSSFALPSPF